jgi:DNA-nicking Smr family endonuclease
VDGDPPDEEPPPVVLPVEDALDLHAFHPRDVRSVVDEYLRAAAERGFAEVRLIHGRGIGAQRAIVQSLLARHPLVVRFFDAPPERGGWGATVAVLRGEASEGAAGDGSEP